MEAISRQMAEGKTINCPGLKLKKHNGYSQKQEVRQKEKKKQKKKNVSEHGKLKEFPTFRHDKQATN